MTKEEAYDALISPLMAQIIAYSKEHDIPMVAVFEITETARQPSALSAERHWRRSQTSARSCASAR